MTNGKLKPCKVPWGILQGPIPDFVMNGAGLQ